MISAIETYSIAPELQEDGSLVWPPFHDLKEPRWRVNQLEKLSSEDRQELENGVREVVSLLPFPVTDILYMGSYVTGWADIMSDFDFALVCDKKSDWVTKEFVYAANELSNRLGVKVEIAPWWGNKVYYSFNEQKFTGKEWGEQMFLNGQPLAFRSDGQGGFIAVEKPPRVVAYELDPYA